MSLSWFYYLLKCDEDQNALIMGRVNRNWTKAGGRLFFHGRVGSVVSVW